MFTFADFYIRTGYTAKLFNILLGFRFNYSIYSMATTDTVYNSTTTADQQPKTTKWLHVPSENLEKIRFVIKVIEVVSNTFV